MGERGHVYVEILQQVGSVCVVQSVKGVSQKSEALK